MHRKCASSITKELSMYIAQVVKNAPRTREDEHPKMHTVPVASLQRICDLTRLINIHNDVTRIPRDGRRLQAWLGLNFELCF